MTWMAMVVRYRAIDRLRREARRPEDAAASGGDFENVPISPETVFDIRARDVMRCLERLAPDPRRAIWLAMREGLTHEEVSARMGRPLGTVKSWIRRGLRDERVSGVMTEEDDLDALAGDYVLGTLTDDERRALEAQMKHDDGLCSRVEAWERRLAPAFVAASQPVEPSADLLAKIGSVIEQRQQIDFGGITVRANEGEWVPLARGSEVKILLVDKVRRQRSFLLRLAAGGHVPAHDHPTTEECMVLSGDMVIGNTIFYPGDFHAAIAGVKHPPLTSRNGGVVFIRGPIYEGYP